MSLESFLDTTYHCEDGYCKCLVCGAVGNVTESIKLGLCHRDLQKELTEILDVIDVSLLIEVLNQGSEENRKLIKKFLHVK